MIRSRSHRAASRACSTRSTQLVSALTQPADTAGGKAQLATSLGSALQQIDQALQQVSTVTAGVGARINLLTAQATTNTASQHDR